ncbi:adenylate/guanylate cyclase domain-containing protein [Devosia sp. XJ19-1]|uniref:Adenylate/guanylate cyclase domain-containing protein n=1 Tax=Devosia ureilytica TaxID=2952754 RepID=A0A9Q4AKL7_9HYPH|nr:adenylate/guanylate cyclase domain-containing protein [Devosia ureilytica]MCP8882486.1 adenylate/guanylate cyclase domain-containing protein [Devosia ureilytica]MCP8885627.1 adenylate/guanylate cyclase domain-containing protein [Devosia ureilytica]
MGRRGWLTFLFGLAVIAGLTLLRAADPYALVVARETTFDTFQQWRPREAPPDLPIRIIDIDEASLAELGQWPWPRSSMAQMATRLTELGAAAIAFDLLFSEPDRLSPSNVAGSGENFDEIFASALAAGPTILSLAQSGRAASTSLEPKSGLATTGSDPLAMLPELGGAAQPLPLLAAASPGLGVASLDRDGAGVARRLPVLWRNGDKVLPTLSAEALRIALGVTTLVVIGDSAGAGTVEQLRIGDFSVPTGPSGDIWLYYRHLPPDLYISARDLLSDDYAELAPLVSGQIVLIGASASGLLDIRASTLGVAVPGVSIHVQALEQMLTNTFLVRADWVAGLEMLIFALAGLIIVLAVIFTGPIVGLAVSIAVCGVLLAASWWAFSVPRLLIDPSFALLGALLLYAAMAFFRFAVTDADRRRIRRAFAHYVEPSLLTRIEADANLLRLGGDVRDLTVMFSDVRNFSALAERTEPSALVAILNRLFASLGAAIVAEQGTIDKFMGDAVMAFWNAPVDVERHADRACRAALAMREALEILNTSERDPIAIGIGIATGPALVGNMGFERRFDYSCIGDTVNVASRIEGMCRAVGHDILVTEKTACEVSHLALLPAGAVELKGMSEREPIHILVGDETIATSPAFAALFDAHTSLLADLSVGGDHTQSLDACRRAALALDSRLGSFYAACVARAQDFSASSAARLVG